MSLPTSSYYQIFNDSADTKLFAYTSGSTYPGTALTLQITGNSSSIIESYIVPYNIGLGISEQQFLSDTFYPSTPGNAWLWNDGNKVKYIKIHHTSNNNQDITPYINNTNIISFYLDSATNSLGDYLHGDGIQEVEDYALDNSTSFPQNYNLLVVDQNNPITSTAVASSNADNIDFNFFASGSYTWYATASGRVEEPVTASSFSSSLAQGFFPSNIVDFGTEQFFRGWTNANYYVQGNLISTTGFLNDNLAHFNTGSTERDYDANNPYQHSVLPFFINAPHSLELISSESFSTYNTQNRIVQIGPRFIYSASISNYGNERYDEDGVYDGVDTTGELKYYYKEDTNEILISDPENILDNPKSSTILYEGSTNAKLVSLGNRQHYMTPEGRNIVIGDGEELWLYRGIQPQGAGRNDDNDAWQYNRYLHRPYKIYMVVQTGSNGLASNIKETHISFSSSLASDRPGEGAYIFNSSLNQNIEITASVTLTASHHGLGYGTASYDSSDEYDQKNPPPTITTWETASLKLYQGTLNNNGFVLASSSIYIDDINTDNKLSLFVDVSSSAINIGDALRLSLSVDDNLQARNINSALVVTDYDMKISASVPDVSDLVPTYLDNILLVSEDCNPIVGNAIEPRSSTLLMDVDYTSGTSGSMHPINFNQILNRTATKATVPDSQYTSKANILGKYIGKQTTSLQYNKWTPGDKISAGKIPNIDYKNAYVGYFSKVIDPYPNLNNKTAYHIKYLIDDQGNLFDPGLNNANYYNLLNTFTSREDIIGTDQRIIPTRAAGIVNNIGENRELAKLDNLSPVWKTGVYPSPILYTQTSSLDYTNNIFLSGSLFYGTLGVGTDWTNFGVNVEALQGQFATNNDRNDPIKLISSTPLYFTSSDVSPFEDNEVVPTGSVAGIPNNTLTISMSLDPLAQIPDTAGQNVSDNAYLLGEFEFYTSTMPGRYSGNNSSDYKVRDFFQNGQSENKWNQMFNTKLKPFRNGSQTNLGLEDVSIELTIIQDVNEPNQITYGPIEIEKNPYSFGEQWRINSSNGIHLFPKSNYLEKRIISDLKGQNWTNHSDRMDNIGLVGGGYTIKIGGNRIEGYTDKSHIYKWSIKWKQKNLKQLENLYWKFEGEVTQPADTGKHGGLFGWGNKANDHIVWVGVNNQQNSGGPAWRRTFSPDCSLNPDYDQANPLNTRPILRYTVTSPLSATNQNQNGATGPFWRRIPNTTDMLYMSSSILNQTYAILDENGNTLNGNYYVQSGLNYTSSTNTDFPLVSEPEFTKFDAILDPWNLQEGDEIRFENNEALTYRITSVEGRTAIEPPIANYNTSSNPITEGLRIVVEPPFEDSEGNTLEPTQFDFFLVRRYKEAKNIVILDQQKPYGIPVSASSSPGILKPEFVTENLDRNPEEIFDELIDKKIID